MGEEMKLWIFRRNKARKNLLFAISMINIMASANNSENLLPSIERWYRYFKRINRFINGKKVFKYNGEPEL